MFNKLIHNETISPSSFITFDCLETARRSQQIFTSNPGAILMLSAVRVPVLVLNHNEQIIAANQWFTELCEHKSFAEIFGKQPELVCPEYFLPNDTSCQTAHTYRCTIDNEHFSIITLVDMPLQQAPPVLAHDLKNGLSAIVGLTSLMIGAEQLSPQETKQYTTLFAVTSEKLKRQIAFAHNLRSSAEETLRIPLQDAEIVSILDQLCKIYNLTEPHKKIELYTPQTSIIIPTDQTLLEQVFENLLKNACEASHKAATIRAVISETSATVQIAVHNPEYIPEEIQLNLFTNENVSTKHIDRGFGTRSIKLFTEKYLRGRVAFLSTPEDGTTFTITLPKTIQN